MRLLLINPWIYDFAAYDLWSKPLGLLYAAAALKEAGHEITLLDCLDRLHPSVASFHKSDEYGTGHFFREVFSRPEIYSHIPRKYKRYGIPLQAFDSELEKSDKPDAVLVTSVMTYWYPGVFEAIARVKSKWPDVPVILGGIYATLIPEHAKKYSGADYVLPGPLSEDLNAILAQLPNGSCETRCLVSLDRLRPAYEFYPRLETAAMLTSFGCPMRCTYCASKLLMSEFYQRSPQDVVAEIEYYVRNLGVRNIAFYDDALLVDPEKHIHPVLDMLIDMGLDCRFHTPNGLHIRYLNRELCEKLFRAGFRTMRLSFESADAKRAQDSSGKVEGTMLSGALDNLRNAGFDSRDIGVYVLLGLPDQTADEILDTLQYVHGAGGLFRITQYSPIPGTLEYQRACKAGFIDSDPLLHNNSVFPLSFTEEGWNAMDSVKKLAKILNAATLEGKSISYSDSLWREFRSGLSRVLPTLI